MNEKITEDYRALITTLQALGLNARLGGTPGLPCVDVATSQDFDIQAFHPEINSDGPKAGWSIEHGFEADGIHVRHEEHSADTPITAIAKRIRQLHADTLGDARDAKIRQTIRDDAMDHLADTRYDVPAIVADLTASGIDPTALAENDERYTEVYAAIERHPKPAY